MAANTYPSDTCLHMHAFNSSHKRPCGQGTATADGEKWYPKAIPQLKSHHDTSSRGQLRSLQLAEDGTKITSNPPSLLLSICTHKMACRETSQGSEMLNDSCKLVTFTLRHGEPTQC